MHIYEEADLEMKRKHSRSLIFRMMWQQNPGVSDPGLIGFLRSP